VGIGTTSPQNTLNVLGDINATTNIFSSGFVNATTDVCLDDGTCLSTVSGGSLEANNSDYLDGYDSSFFMPLNTSVVGDFDFNGGWTDNGVSIVDGNIYAQSGYF